MTTVQPVSVAERGDIHKSCRALETVVNLLDDYSEAARAIVTLHKKLAKALRDVATVKPTGEIPGNAFSTSANVFEVLSDVDTKFSKFVDRECDVISGEVKKWFKKLTKEEKAHDERIASANAKIKQAGQLYERKVKKNAVDANEEHNRYMNILNTLGPEISQTKYNHALSVSQKNTTVTFQVAATLSRVAEAEWLRSAEGIRRFSPLIGLLGEWKALCEGGWTGSVPGDLPDVDQTPDPPRTIKKLDAAELSRYLGTTPTSPRPLPVPGSVGAVSLKLPLAVYDDGSVRSITSLGSFPEPPNHFPIPPLSGSFSSNSAATNSPVILYSLPIQGDGPFQSRTSSDVSGALPRVTESPLEENAAALAPETSSSPPESSRDALMTSPTAPVLDEKNDISVAEDGLEPNTGEPTAIKDTPSPQVPNPESLQRSIPFFVPPPPPLPAPTTQLRHQPEPALPINPRANLSTAAGNTFRRGDYLDNREFGAEASTEAMQLKAKTPGFTWGRVERSDTLKSNGSMVAAIRDKYTRVTGPASLPPRDIPRLPLSVATIATKYQSENDNEPSSPRWQTRSPTSDQSQRSRDPGSSSPLPQPQQTQLIPSIAPGRAESPTDELLRRRQRIEELEGLEQRERALEFRAREREFEARQRERAETLHNKTLDGYAIDTQRSNQPFLAHRPQSQASLQSQLHAPSLASSHSYSTTSLLPSGTSAPASPAVHRTIQDVHRPNCECPACTVARYAEKPLAARPRQEREKSKGGWMRRLSMPVVSNAFSSESKKLGTAGGRGVGPKGSLEEANRSAVSLGRR
ncbi:hypothetical protein B0F90DRAFT_1740927 [Multifurca ochricompacta]|uniref:Uncharacterized protein n=1 Tax=Multifurca ochricompacta TaxID=376703 RepID=A0AAD4QLW0_9AGAM|nr:hypothetical protein B0F90DRAFT_1740927 [Multifurca ochricompacta]